MKYYAALFVLALIVIVGLACATYLFVNNHPFAGVAVLFVIASSSVRTRE